VNGCLFVCFEIDLYFFGSFFDSWGFNIQPKQWTKRMKKADGFFLGRFESTHPARQLHQERTQVEVQ